MNGTLNEPSVIYLLTRAIMTRPDAPFNYVLRGEEWLARGDTDRARADFEAARLRAKRAMADSAWEYLYQACIDRAETGLQQCLPDSPAS
jgi:tetratricopeptide (TPR) repeat protein